ncbi:T9SS-dependent M36 family metallopeptidase, partial [Oceanihabitans sp.]|nr:T9SS-dependent M36 family metallopeptidase [Oceanihabitans sp.]
KKSDYNLIDNDIQDLYVTNEFFSKSSEITHVYVNQRYQGIKIHNAISSVAIKDGAVFYYANNLIGNIQSRVNTVSPSINAETAIQRAASYFELGSASGLELISSNGNDFIFTNGGISKNEIPVSLVYTQTRAGNLILSWNLNIHTNNGKDWWSARVDALSGEVIDSNNWILTCNFGDGNHINHSNHKKENTSFNLFKSNSYIVSDGSQYNVFELPISAPNDGERNLITEPADNTASPFGWHDINGVIGAEFNTTRGNNARAMEDLDGNGGIGISADGGPTLNFDFPLDLNQAPLGYLNASLTNLFYVNNMMHDIWYQYGFDEASGNFQENNYGRGGLASDFVFANGQDGSFLNNASFGTPPDGANPGMNMFLWSEPFFFELLTVNTGSVAGAYTAFNPATGVDNNIPGATDVPVTADLILVNDGTAAPTEACNAVVNDLTGKIAVIKRGNCTFVDKIQNAQDAGAVGVIMVNHNNPAGDPAYTEYVNMAGMTTPPFSIPSVFVNNEDGELIIAALESGETLNATLQDRETFQLDGSLDNGIVSHEYGHGISTRLTGGAGTSDCLGNAEQQGEGWSDWFAMMLTIKPGDSGDDARAAVTYSLGQPYDGPGLPDRPYRYSTDMTENPLTYGDTNDPSLVQPHGIGSVWATILWDLSWAYIDKYGYDEDLLNGIGGNNKVMQIVIDGLKLHPCGTGFVQSRDALLAADTALTGGEDQCLIWEVFANRGVGLIASQGSFFSRTDQVESFELPSDTDPTLANCTSLSVDEFNKNDYKIYPNPANNNVFIKTNKNFGEVTMTLIDINGRIVYSQKTNLVNEVQINMSKLQSGLYILNIKGETINTNDKIIKN